jgi:hypothetical protein
MSRSRYTILTCQARIPAAHSNLPEVPAGMLDGSGNFKGVAAEEIQEECHIVIAEAELIDLTALAYGDRWRGMYPSAGVRACVWTGDDDHGVVACVAIGRWCADETPPPVQGCDEFIRLYLLRRTVEPEVRKRAPMTPRARNSLASSVSGSNPRRAINTRFWSGDLRARGAADGAAGGRGAHQAAPSSIV